MKQNLTMHPIVLNNNGKTEEISPSGWQLRVIYDAEVIGDIDGFPIRKLTPSGLMLVDNKDMSSTKPMPSQEEGITYIVSALAFAQAMVLGRTDLICPDTDQAVKNEKGHVLNVPGFAIYG